MSVAVFVAVDVEVRVGDAVAVGVLVPVGASVGVFVDVPVGVELFDGVAVGVFVPVEASVGVFVDVPVGVGLFDGVAVGVLVTVGATVAVFVGVGVEVFVAVLVGVFVDVVVGVLVEVDVGVGVGPTIMAPSTPNMHGTCTLPVTSSQCVKCKALVPFPCASKLIVTNAAGTALAPLENVQTSVTLTVPAVKKFAKKNALGTGQRASACVAAVARTTAES